MDSARGTDLGHAPAAAVDEIGIAIAATTKTLRSVQRSMRESDSKKQKSDRLVASGLCVWTHLPKSLELICWPTIVAFSLSIKQWGHVLVDGLSPVVPSNDAWEQLVLPERTKEMLLAMTSSTASNTAEAETSTVQRPRYRYRDIVDSKGGGVLFLLYGAPGTGKTVAWHHHHHHPHRHCHR